MTKSHTRPDPSLLVIRGPNCPNCDSRMMLAGITGGPKGFDIRTFQCRKCDHSFTTAIASDPMKGASARWIEGELKPPN